MKRAMIVVGFLVLWGAAATSDVFACGDKFLMPSRGTRYSRATALRRPAAILVYASPSSAVTKTIGIGQLDALNKAGHKTVSVSGLAQLEQALRQGGWDLVLADLADSAVVRGRLQGAGAPMLVPVVYNAPNSAVSQAKKDYKLVVKGPVKSQAFLETVDDAVELREKLRTKATH